MDEQRPWGDLPNQNRKGAVTAWLFCEAFIAVAVAIYIRVHAANRISGAFDPSAIQVQQVNGQATLDMLLLLVIVVVVMAATAAFALPNATKH